MFYSNNDSYMQDLYFYNQNPNSGNNYNQFMNNMNPAMQNPSMMNNMNNMYMNQNSNTPYGMNHSQNLNNLYPSIYRIILPVASRVIANSNYQYINEDVLNNMVDTVYNIVDGQITYEEDSNTTNKQEVSVTNNNSNNSQNNNSASITKTTDTRQPTTQTATSSRSNRPDSLLRDIIKIIILREILSRNPFMANQSQNYMQSPSYCNSQMYNW